MNPRDFHQLALDLLGGARPAELRTAVSRAYYSAYNVGVEVLKKMGFQVPEDASGHYSVRERLRYSGDYDVQGVGHQLRDLYRHRVHADYRLDDAQIESPATAQALVQQAGRMIQILDACLCEPKRSRVRNSISGRE